MLSDTLINIIAYKSCSVEIQVDKILLQVSASVHNICEIPGNSSQ